MSSVDKIANAVVRQEVSPRGGGVEIRLDDWGYPHHKMTAYQNYLGGGMLGKVCSDCTVVRLQRDRVFKRTQCNAKDVLS
jgi:hypothetical protein